MGCSSLWGASHRSGDTVSTRLARTTPAFAAVLVAGKVPMAGTSRQAGRPSDPPSCLVCTGAEPMRGSLQPSHRLGEKIRAWGAGGRACDSHPSRAHGHLGARRGVAGAKAGHPWTPMCRLRRGLGGHPPRLPCGLGSAMCCHFLRLSSSHRGRASQHSWPHASWAADRTLCSIKDDTRDCQCDCVRLDAFCGWEAAIRRTGRLLCLAENIFPQDPHTRAITKRHSYCISSEVFHTDDKWRLW